MMMRKSSKTAWGLLAPTLLILGVFGFLPFIYVVYIGFHDWIIFARNGGLVWSGIENYRRLVFDEAVLAALGRGLSFTFWAVSIQMILGLLLAHLLMNQFKGKSFFRAIHALPLTVAPLVVGAAWRLLTLPGLGPLPHFLGMIGFEYNIGVNAEQAFYTIILMDTWRWTPFVTLTLLAGLSALPKEPFEGAQVDGANKWQMFYLISMPMLKPVILTSLFLRIMDALRVVDEVWMLTGGGPGTATRFIGIHIWRVVFPKTDYGYGSAMSVILLYLIIVLCWFLLTIITQPKKA